MPINRAYGWKAQIPSIHDHALTVGRPATLPPSADLRPRMPVAYDQAILGSCTGNMAAAAVEFIRKQEGRPDLFTPARLALYYWERAKEGTVKVDAGATIRDAYWVLQHHGAPPEDLWPYDVKKFARKPSARVDKAARLDVAVEYQAVPQSVGVMRGVLAAGYPIGVGFSVYESFESQDVARTGVVHLPQASEQLLGGHAVLVVGYDSQADTWIVRNSWGNDWGQDGYFTMPTAYLASPQLASDFWVLKQTT